MKNKLSLAALAAIAAMQMGCFHVKWNTGKDGGKPAETKWHVNYIYFIEAAKVDLAKECPGGFTMVDQQISIVPGLVGAITGHLYAPTDYTVSCIGAPGSTK